MCQDIFEFWSRIADNEFVHPDDREVLERVDNSFQLDCFPIAFSGALRTAPVVLLFLSPGFDDSDRHHAQSETGRDWYKSQRGGSGKLALQSTHIAAWKWWTRIFKQFEIDANVAVDNVAILNIGAYHSRKFVDWNMLSALPSSRRALDYAQSQLFPQGVAGERVVICMRSAKQWGLSRGNDGAGKIHGRSLFVPACTPGGAMLKGEMRDSVKAAVRGRLLSGAQG